MQHMFVHFLKHEFIYDGKESDKIWESMSEYDKKHFCFNIRQIDWTKCLQGFQYGVRRFYIKEDCYAPNSTYT